KERDDLRHFVGGAQAAEWVLGLESAQPKRRNGGEHSSVCGPARSQRPLIGHRNSGSLVALCNHRPRGAAAQGGVMGKVAWGFTASIDGFIAGPGHDMSWLSASEPNAEGTTEGMAAKVAVIISGRRGYDAARAQADERDEMTSEAYGGAWSGTEFVLTHRPEELAGDASVTAMNCTITEAVEKA